MSLSRWPVLAAANPSAFTAGFNVGCLQVFLWQGGEWGKRALEKVTLEALESR